MDKNTIIITGVDGMLGGKITRRILCDTDFQVLGLTMNLSMPEVMMEREGIRKDDRVRFMTNEEFLNPSTRIGNLFGAVHLAFSRRMQPAKDIASSIDFAASVFHRLAEVGADRVINVSSQGVYGNTEEIRKETTPPAPVNNYTMAKYASEKLFDDIMRESPHHTNLRLDPVAQSQNVVRRLCSSAIEGTITLKGGKQVFSFIDAEDIGRAVVAMITSEGEWDSVYNVGWNRKRYTLVELAELIAGISVDCGFKRPEIVLQEDDTSLWAGMDSSKFMNKTGWVPEIDLKKTIAGMLKNQ